MDVQDVARRLDVDGARGLDTAEAHRRQAWFGPNQWQTAEQEPLREAVLEVVREPLILLLLGTGLLYALLGEMGDALIIFFVIFTLMAVEIFNARRAEQAIAALRTLAEPTAAVRRGGGWWRCPARPSCPAT